MSASPSDVCVICEGCYPFVVGGVSSWLQGLIQGLPGTRFSVLAIVGGSGPREPRYPRPPNLEALHVLDLDRAPLHEVPGAGEPADWELARRFLRGLAAGRPRGFADFTRSIRGLGPGALDPRHLLEGHAGAFGILRDLAEDRQPTAPLLESVSSFRSMLLPLLRVLQAPVPPAARYHAVSTGYAGLAGAVARVVTGRPLVVTEHGLYTKEAELEVRRASWLPDRQKVTWTQFFRGLGRIAYEEADEVTSLFARNRRLQVALGAPGIRTRVIPNGIDTSAYASAGRDPAGGPTVGIVARLAPIKDVKTFLRAGRVLADLVPGVRLHVLGPDDEAPEYAEECRFLARDLGLAEVVTFEGRVDTRAWYPRLDVVVLSSIKEAQPLSLLEAMAAGCLVVGTAVGAVPELLREIGEVVPQRRPGALARAVARLIALDPAGLRARREAGIRRAGEYGMEAFLGAYRDLYHPGGRGATP